jgi:PiT family inorganic phosphate transporter
MSYAIGANDAANALATSYGSKACPLMALLLMGALFEFIGAFWCSGQVAGKLAENIIPALTMPSELGELVID